MSKKERFNEWVMYSYSGVVRCFTCKKIPVVENFDYHIDNLPDRCPCCGISTGKNIGYMYDAKHPTYDEYSRNGRIGK